MKQLIFYFYMHSLFKLPKIITFLIINFFILSFLANIFTTGEVFAATDVEAALGCVVAPLNPADQAVKSNYPACTSIDTGDLGFQIPSLGDLLTFVIRVFFVIAGISALFYMLIGAFSWVTSGGDKDAVTAAREKIQAAVVGMILIVAVLAIIWTLEQVIFKRRICLGLSCPLTLPGLIERTGTDYCCVCVTRSNNTLGQIVNTSKYKCDDFGKAVAL